MKILVTYAVQGEFTELRFPGKRGDEEVQVGYLRTGIGKVKSAYYLAEAIRSTQPDLVVNIGTAGTLTHRVGEVLVCRRFVDRDMERVKGYLRQGFKTVISIAPSYAGVLEFDTPGQVVDALQRLGFREVRETAEGAALVTNEYKKLVRQNKMPNIITTCCIYRNIF